MTKCYIRENQTSVTDFTEVVNPVRRDNLVIIINSSGVMKIMAGMVLVQTMVPR